MNIPNTLNVISNYPGAGKGTVISDLKDAMGHNALEHFEVGAMVRAHIRKDTQFGRAAVQYAEMGEMVPDTEILEQITETLKLLKSECVWLLDGLPRSGGQIQSYSELMTHHGRNDHALLIEVPRKVAEERMIKRAELAISKGEKPRSDDAMPAKRRRRLDIAEGDMNPVKQYFGSQDKLTTIDGTKSIAEVCAEVRDFVREIGILALVQRLQEEAKKAKEAKAEMIMQTVS